MIAESPALDALFEASSARVRELLEACPERRDLLHGDLLSHNVLLADDLSDVSAVFSWKCSALGDFLFDTAWCTFWKSWYPGMAAIDVWSDTVTAPDLTASDLVDAAVRHHCYELQIGAGHLGWHLWANEAEGLAYVVRRLEEVLERGPLTTV